MEKALAKEIPQDEKTLLPWMPYIFGFILCVGAVGLYFLLADKTAPTIEVASSPTSESRILEPIKSFLQEIKNKQLKNAYSKTSTDFKVSMSFEGFSSFINQYESLSDWTAVTFSTPQIGKSVSGVVAYLHFAEEEEQTLPITFTLLEEEGEWKIYSLLLNSAETDMPIREIEQHKESIHTINQMLAYLKRENYMAAYYKLTTKNFQKETPYETFVQFIQGAPSFIEQTAATYHEAENAGPGAIVKVTLHDEDNTLAVDFVLAKEEGIWKIDKIEMLLPSTLERPLSTKQVDDSMEIIDLFLKTLQQQRFEKAYTLFTSSRFQKSTSLTLFESFIKDHPVFLEGERPKFLDGGAIHQDHLVYLLYGKPPYRSAFEIRLIQEGGSWKIQGISLEKPRADSYPDETLDKTEALDLVQPILNLLANSQYERFYRYTASSSFKKWTSYEELVQYVETHKIFKSDPKVFIEEMVQDRDQLLLEMNLIDDADSYSTLFAFTFEDGTWKIQRFETKLDRQIAMETAPATIELSKLLVGQDIDELGMIQDAGSVLEKSDEPIYLSVLLISSHPGTEVEVQLTHEESQTATAPVSGMVDDEGNNILTFSFSPPDEGWPEGHYTASARANDTNILEIPFMLEPQDNALSTEKTTR